MASGSEITAIGAYVQFWFPEMAQWDTGADCRRTGRVGESTWLRCACMVKSNLVCDDQSHHDYCDVIIIGLG
ncbi:hypothetical protein KCP77_01310 [Salmonella enterica subsp. enterica]|nr:hypothetical protein KCP77_01310 [Salmonella enterica subsp. enterica]